MLTFSDSSGREVHELKIHFLHRNVVPRLQYCTRRHWQFPQNTSSENSPRGNRGWPGFGCLFCCPSSWSLMSTHDKRRALLSCSRRACTPGLGARTKHWAPNTGPQGIREHWGCAPCFIWTTTNSVPCWDWASALFAYTALFLLLYLLQIQKDVNVWEWALSSKNSLKFNT